MHWLTLSVGGHVVICVKMLQLSIRKSEYMENLHCSFVLSWWDGHGSHICFILNFIFDHKCGGTVGWGSERSRPPCSRHGAESPPVASRDPEPNRVERLDRMFGPNVFVQFAKCIWPGCKMYFTKLLKVFVQISKIIFPNQFSNSTIAQSYSTNSTIY